MFVYCIFYVNVFCFYFSIIITDLAISILATSFPLKRQFFIAAESIKITPLFPSGNAR